MRMMDVHDTDDFLGHVATVSSGIMDALEPETRRLLSAQTTCAISSPWMIT
jgi:hypothetical protein